MQTARKATWMFVLLLPRQAIAAVQRPERDFLHQYLRKYIFSLTDIVYTLYII